MSSQTVDPNNFSVPINLPSFLSHCECVIISGIPVENIFPDENKVFIWITEKLISPTKKVVDVKARLPRSLSNLDSSNEPIITDINLTHIHANKDTILDKFTLENGTELYWDGYLLLNTDTSKSIYKFSNADLNAQYEYIIYKNRIIVTLIVDGNDQEYKNAIVKFTPTVTPGTNTPTGELNEDGTPVVDTRICFSGSISGNWKAYGGQTYENNKNWSQIEGKPIFEADWNIANSSEDTINNKYNIAIKNKPNSAPASKTFDNIPYDISKLAYTANYNDISGTEISDYGKILTVLQNGKIGLTENISTQDLIQTLIAHGTYTACNKKENISFNGVYSNGFYEVYNPTFNDGNNPGNISGVNAHFNLINICNSQTTHITQIATQISTGDLYVRNWNSVTWSPWSKYSKSSELNNHAQNTSIHVNQTEKNTWNSSMPVGSIISYVSSTPPTGWLLCNGQDVDPNLYPQLYNLLPAGNKKTPNLNTVSSIQDSPTFLRGSTDYTGIPQEAGLPNIQGIWSGSVQNDWDNTYTGAFYLYSDSYVLIDRGDYGHAYKSLGFDASRSNDTYGKSSTVRPKNIGVVMIIKAN